jgi:hypothetical protein
MAIELEQVIGPVPRADGLTDGPVRVDREGAAMVGDAHARYMEAARRGGLFFACNSASQALSLNSATATGLILSNPLGSGKNLALVELCVALLTAPAGVSSLILTGHPTVQPTANVHTTPLVIKNALLGQPSTAVATADSAATLPSAPTILRPVGGGPVATGSVTAPFIKDEIAGAIVLAPGTSIGLQALTTAISVIASMTWEEFPI